MFRCTCSFLIAGDAGCGAEFEGIEEEYSARELAVSCPCATWLDDGFVRDAGTCTSVNGESKGKSSGKYIEDVVLSLWNVLQSLQVVRVGSAACTAFIGSFFAAVACRRAAAFSGVISVMVIEVQAAAALQLSVTLVLSVPTPFVESLLFQAAAALMYQNSFGSGFVTPVVEGWLLQAAAAQCYPNALVDVLSTPFVGFFSILVVCILAWSGLVLGLVHATC